MIFPNNNKIIDRINTSTDILNYYNTKKELLIQKINALYEILDLNELYKECYYNDNIKLDITYINIHKTNLFIEILNNMITRDTKMFIELKEQVSNAITNIKNFIKMNTKMNENSINECYSILYEYEKLCNIINRNIYTEELHKELIQKQFHPNNINKFVEWGYEGYEE